MSLNTAEREQLPELTVPFGDRLPDLLSKLPAFFWETELNADLRTSHFTYLSDNAERMLGYPREHLLRPESWQEMVHPEDREVFYQQTRSLYASSDRATIHHRILTADGHVLP
ncbi:MAG: PAS domain-containing protein, partial [Bacteroidota bacterium]|nr:PAS domain-containing protein [Bacteroidota bacterium]